MNMKNFLEGLSPELQEKAKACKTTEELLKLADENDIELKPEALEAVSGGCGSSEPEYCPKCGTLMEEVYLDHGNYGQYVTRCPKCSIF